MILKFFVPKKQEKNERVNSIINLLKRYKSLSKIEIMDDLMEENLKFNTLIPLAVYNRIKIKQTKKSKLLYPQLVLYIKDKAITFYPQSNRNKEIDIETFLENFLNNKKILCLHNLPEELKI